MRTADGLTYHHSSATYPKGSFLKIARGVYVCAPELVFAQDVYKRQPETREYYRLEALWNDAPVIDLAAEAGLENLQYLSLIHI